MSVCDEEPCKSRRQKYWHLVDEAMARRRELTAACHIHKWLERLWNRAFAIWAALFVQALACSIFPIFPHWVCQALWIAVLFAFMALFYWFIRYVATGQGLQRATADCGLAAIDVEFEWRKVREDCPEECWPLEIKIDCDCH